MKMGNDNIRKKITNLKIGLPSSWILVNKNAVCIHCNSVYETKFSSDAEARSMWDKDHLPHHCPICGMRMFDDVAPIDPSIMNCILAVEIIKTWCRDIMTSYCGAVNSSYMYALAYDVWSCAIWPQGLTPKERLQIIESIAYSHKDDTADEVFQGYRDTLIEYIHTLWVPSDKVKVEAVDGIELVRDDLSALADDLKKSYPTIATKLADFSHRLDRIFMGIVE